ALRGPDEEGPVDGARALCGALGAGGGGRGLKGLVHEPILRSRPAERLVVERPAERVDHAAEQLVADGDIGGAARGHDFATEADVTQLTLGHQEHLAILPPHDLFGYPRDPPTWEKLPKLPEAGNPARPSPAPPPE